MVDLRTKSGRAGFWISLGAASIGFCMFTAWLAGITFAEGGVLDGLTADPTAAAAFILAGAALALFLRNTHSTHSRSRSLCLTARLCALAVLILGLAALGSHWLARDAKLVHWFSTAGLGSRLPSRAEFAPVTALNFVLLGGALLFAGATGRLVRFGTEMAVLGVGFTAFLAALARAYNIQLFVGGGSTLLMTLPNAILFSALAAAFLLSHTDGGLLKIIAGKSLGGVIARRLLPAGLIVPPVLGWFTRYAEQIEFLQPGTGEAMEAVGTIVVCTALVCWCAKGLDRADRDRTAAETSRRESEQRFSQAFTQSPIGTALVSPQGRWLKTNPALCDLVGYSEEELLTRTFQDITHPDDLAIGREKITQMLAGQITKFQVEKRYLHADGHVITVLLSSTLVRDARGEPSHCVTQIQDISERKKGEIELLESKRFLRSTLDALSSHIAILDEHGMIVEVNNAWSRFAVGNDFAADHHGVGKNYLAVCDTAGASSKEGAAVAHGLRAVIAGETETFQLEYPCHSPTQEQWFSVRVTRFLANGALRIVLAHDDITERKQAAENRRAKEEAERANREKSKFLSRMSHELRTPLNAILGFGQVLELSDLGGQDAVALSHILKGGQHLLALIDEVLDLSRAESGELRLDVETVDAVAVAQECVDLLGRMAEARRLRCIMKNTQRRLMLHCDEQRLRQILLNLLSNAIKYNREGGQVLVSFEPMLADRVRINVTDTGPGIPAEGVARLFTPFERLEYENGEVEGTGLGLVVSQRIAGAMDGSVGVESEVGRGSKFWLELPLAAEEPAPVADLARPVSPSILNAGVSPDTTLLYIEDNLSNLQVMEMLLARCRPQWRFLSARDGLQGLDQARQGLPDLILLDLQLPGMPGEEVLGALRRDSSTRQIPVIVLSADATPHSREHLLACGAQDYVTKPFQVDVLLEQLDRSLEKISPVS